ncbi:MAG: hypothetical protein JWO38_1386 [Gemmataceae bacterium]|nr:hypothetical protein [Gemmataceae bacterium]
MTQPPDDPDPRPPGGACPTSVGPGGPAVPLTDFILRVFVLVDDLVKDPFPGRFRRRGPPSSPTAR